MVEPANLKQMLRWTNFIGTVLFLFMFEKVTQSKSVQSKAEKKNVSLIISLIEPTESNHCLVCKDRENC